MVKKTFLIAHAKYSPLFNWIPAFAGMTTSIQTTLRHCLGSRLFGDASGTDHDIGHGKVRKIYTGVNQDAIPAELMYQIGLSLIKTRCCRQRGLQYIEQASRLFPTSKLYGAAYQHYKIELHKHDEYFGSK